MLLNQHRLKAEIAERAANLTQERQELVAQLGALRSNTKHKATSPLTLGILFIAGLGIGLLSGRNWLPKGLGWMAWRSGVPLLTGLVGQWVAKFLPQDFNDGEMGNADMDAAD